MFDEGEHSGDEIGVIRTRSGHFAGEDQKGTLLTWLSHEAWTGVAMHHETGMIGQPFLGCWIGVSCCCPTRCEW